MWELLEAIFGIREETWQEKRERYYDWENVFEE